MPGHQYEDAILAAFQSLGAEDAQRIAQYAETLRDWLGLKERDALVVLAAIGMAVHEPQVPTA